MDRHHIIPRYQGGSNKLDNIVKVSRTCHVMWHFANWQLWGNKEDYIAYRGLAGSITQLEIEKELINLAQEKQKLTGKGLHGFTSEERAIYGRKGGLIGGKHMSGYKWITDGVNNSRIPRNMELPEGWVTGVTRKKPRIKKPKYGKRKDYASVQKDFSNKLMSNRYKDLELIDLTKRGAIAQLSKLWGVSHTQVKRYLVKMGV